MKRFVLALALAFAAITAFASSPSINTAYRVTGHPDAAPVQVFDDGRELFVQLRDPTRVPAPFVDGKPTQFRIRGPYLILPLLPHFDLRLGAAIVTVTRSGMPTGKTARVFATVDPLAPSATKPGNSTKPAEQTLSTTNTIPSQGMVGDITLETDPIQPASQTPNTTRTPILHIHPPTRAMFEPFRGKRVVILADGTVAGARHADGLRALCLNAGPSACSIRYRGAAVGTSTLEIL